MGCREPKTLTLAEKRTISCLKRFRLKFRLETLATRTLQKGLGVRVLPRFGNCAGSGLLTCPYKFRCLFGVPRVVVTPGGGGLGLYTGIRGSVHVVKPPGVVPLRAGSFDKRRRPEGSPKELVTLPHLPKSRCAPQRSSMMLPLLRINLFGV